MTTFITLSHVQVQNANCVAGITYGFPGITNFLGYVHALSIKLQKTHGVTLNGCAVVCHHHQVLAHRIKSIKDGKVHLSDYVFSQMKNPAAFPYQEKNIGGDPPIIEEGKMHMTVSLVIECEGFNGSEADKRSLEDHISQLAFIHKLAGGVITKIKGVFLETVNDDASFRRIRRRLMPGFILMDRSAHLLEHFSMLKQSNSYAQMLDAWLDFSALKFRAVPLLEEGETLSMETNAHWEYQASTLFSGWLVPIMIGYRAISELYDPGVVANTRDPSVPFCFTEAVYSIGEWLSPHRINDLQQTIWRYMPPENGWYLCKQANNAPIQEVGHEVEDEMDLYTFSDN